MDNLKKQKLLTRYRNAIEKSNFDIEKKEKMKNILNEIDSDFLDDNDSKNFFDILRKELDDDDILRKKLDDHDNLEKLINDFKNLNVSNSPRRSIQPVTKEIINNFYKNIEKNRRLSRKRKSSKTRSSNTKRRRTLPKTIVDEIGEDELDKLYSDVENISINSPYDVLKGKRKRGGSKNKTKKRK